MKIKFYRTYGEEEIKLCEHISIYGKLEKDEDGCEYIENWEIGCKICNVKHEVQELIN